MESPSNDDRPYIGLLVLFGTTLSVALAIAASTGVLLAALAIVWPGRSVPWQTIASIGLKASFISVVAEIFAVSVNRVAWLTQRTLERVEIKPMKWEYGYMIGIQSSLGGRVIGMFTGIGFAAYIRHVVPAFFDHIFIIIFGIVGFCFGWLIERLIKQFAPIPKTMSRNDM